jgi:hypothetical protein
MRNQVNAGGNITSKTDGSGVAAISAYYVQKADIALGYWHDDGDGIVENGEIYDALSGGAPYPASNWTPIGTEYIHFSGSYNGSGYSVRGIYINNNNDCQGLFYYIATGGTVTNLGVEDSFIRCRDYASILAGRNDGIITGCLTSGSVIVVAYCSGGVVASNSNTLTACFSLSNVSGGDYVGGVAGINGGNISNCYNAGSKSGSYVGGVVGYNTSSGHTDNCYNAGSVSGSYAGGVVGRKAGWVTNSYYDSQICALLGGFGTGAPEGATGQTTQLMTAGTVFTGWSTDAWVFTSGLYPRLKGYENTNAAFVSASPMFLSGTDTIGRVTNGFTVSTENGVSWFSSDLGTIQISGGSATVLKSGSNVTLTAKKGGAIKAVTLGTVLAAPTVLPAGGSFTDTDDIDAGEIGGTIAWTAASPAAYIDGYHIYWGSSATAKLAGQSTYLYEVTGAAAASQTVAANTALPAGATHFLIYSFNAAGDSGNCLAVAITDLYRGLNGLGTSGSPFEIWTRDDLAYMRDRVNANGTITSKTDGSGVTARTAYYIQKADIALGYWQDDGDGLVEDGEIFDAPSGGSAYTASNWTPIGTFSINFGGNYNGGGYTVSGIYINSSIFDQGLFGDTGSDSKISRLGIEDSFVKGVNYCGLLVGVNNGELTGCHTAGSVIGNGCLGGVAGANAGTITACYNLSNVSGVIIIGGVVGENNENINDCYNTGNISGSNTDINGSITGGITGRNYGYLNRCYSAGSVSGSNAGGVAGFNDCIIYACYYDSQICTLTAVTGSGNTIPYGAGLSTQQMTVGSPFSGWSADTWVFTSGLYPRLKDYENTYAAYVSASPVFLSGTDTAGNVTNHFTVSTLNGVSWSSSDSSTIQLSGGNATVLQSGNNVTLTASKGGITKTVPLGTITKPINALAGTAAIHGSAVYGETLTVSLDGGNNTGTLSCQWLRDGADILGAEENAYILTADDIGAVISVKITSSVETGTVLSSPTAAVEKAACAVSPVAAPVLAGRTADSVTLTAVAGYEYILVAGGAEITTGTWQDSNTFTSLAESTAYDIYQRVKETETHKPSAVSAKLYVSTDPGALIGTAIIAGSAVYGETLTASLSGNNNTGTLSCQWVRDTADILGAQAITYVLTADDIGKVIAVKISSSVETGTVISSPTAAVQKAACAVSQAAAPVLAGRATDSITLAAVTGYEYILVTDGVEIATGIWQDGSVFTALAAYSPYDAYQRVKETDTHKPSAVSAKLDVQTADTLVSGVLTQPFTNLTVSLQGLFGRDAALAVTPIQEAGADYSLLSNSLGGKMVLAAYDIAITPDDAFGLPLTLGFMVDEKYNGQSILILHKLKSGTVEQFSPTVSGGWVYVTVTELSPFMMAVEPDVLITVQPEDAMVLAGQTATFKVEAKGLGLAYQWQRRTGPTDSWRDIPGAISTSYTTTKVNKSHNGYQYRVIISDGYGNSVTSGIATLYISVSPDTGDRQNPVLYACLAILSTAVGLRLIKKRRAA